VDELDYEQVVGLYHEDLYRFAFGLTGTADDASELTQETYSRLLTRSSQIHDHTKVKSWMFTTLYRIFLTLKRRSRRFPEIPLESAETELPTLSPGAVQKMDSETVMTALVEVDEIFRAPLMLFYLEDLSYREIAEALNLPIGTVMSRLSRGKDLLRERLTGRAPRMSSRIIPLAPVAQERRS
jgi:RNA polymerase sigma-70 factor (ECF subfamily)